MKAKQTMVGILSGCGIFLLILNNRTALAAAEQGLTLCIRSLIPGMLPFFFLNHLLTESLLGREIPGLRVLGWIAGLPAGSESLLIPAFLGGYPMGARATAQAWESGRLDEANARRMLYFCCNAGPAFLFGVLLPMFPRKSMVFLLWAIQISAALLLAAFLPEVPGRGCREPEKRAGLAEAMKTSLTAMGSVCGWVICFRVFHAVALQEFLRRLPEEWQILASGFWELTGGCLALGDISSLPMRFLIASVLLSFGGLCAAMQTLSCIGKLPAANYLKGKLMQALISGLLAPAVLRVPMLLPVFLILPAAIRFALKKRGGNQRVLGV